MQPYEIGLLAAFVPIAAVLSLYVSFRAYRAYTGPKRSLPKQYSRIKDNIEEGDDIDLKADLGARIRVGLEPQSTPMELATTALPSFRGKLTMWDLFESAASGKFATLPAHGTFNAEKQDFDYETYSSVLADVKVLAQGLEELKLISDSEDESDMRLFGLFGPNSSNWVKLEYAAMSQSATLVTLYTTLTLPGIEHVLQLTKVSTVACLTLDCAKRCLQAKTDTLRNIVVLERAEELLQLAAEAQVEVITLDQVREAGSKAATHALRPPTPETIWTFCFTSGSTGAPKGALISHLSIVANAAMMADKFTYFVAGEEYYLSYLPIAHQMERTTIAIMTSIGAKVAFSRGELAKLMDDIKLLRPTFFATVPRLLTRISRGLEDKIAASKPVVQKLFAKAVNSKLYDMDKYGHLTHPVWDKLVFKKINVALGFDRLKSIGTGSAPIAPQTLDFLRVVFAVPVTEAYGQTEATCGVTAAHPLHVGGPKKRLSHVGAPMQLAQVRLESVPEMNYLVTDRVHDSFPVVGRGEILVKSPAVMNGYFALEEKTKETITESGWLHTGDIGAWLEDGTLSVIDRKNNIFKTSVGEYVQLDKIERAVCSSNLVQACFVFGTTLNSKVVCIAVLADGVVETPETKQQILAAARQAGLLGFEVPGAIRCKTEPFTAESGVLTATAKIVRGVAKHYFQADIESMYAELGEEVKV